MATKSATSSDKTLAGDAAPSEDTAKAVQMLMETMQARFQQLSDRIISRIDDMGNRIDDLEKNIAVLMKESEGQPVNRLSSTATGVSPSGKLVPGLRTPQRD